MPRTGRHPDGKTASLPAAISPGAGPLTAATALPVLGIAGTAARDAARTFKTVPVAGPGQLPARSDLLDSAAIEDWRLYLPGAIDLRGTARALISTLSASQVPGCSTLAQSYFENQSYGFAVASQFYFSTWASNRSLTQAGRSEETQ